MGYSCRASCGVLGLELPVDMVLGGTTGDWDPEDGLCPLVASGAAWREGIKGLRTSRCWLATARVQQQGQSPVPGVSSDAA